MSAASHLSTRSLPPKGIFRTVRALGRVELRRYLRIRADDLIAVSRANDRVILGEGIDLGLGGIRFEVPGSKFKVGDTLEVVFVLGDGSASAMGTVVRATKAGLLSQEIAVEFVKAGEETLARFQQLGLVPGAGKPEAF